MGDEEQELRVYEYCIVTKSLKIILGLALCDPGFKPGREEFCTSSTL